MSETRRRRATDREPTYKRSMQFVGYTLPLAVTVGGAIAIAIAL